MKEPLFTIDDFYATDWDFKSYFIDVLNGEMELQDAREGLRSLIGSKYDSRIKDEQSNDI